MVLQQLGALRFAGLFSDFGSLPLDPNLNGAIFDAVDTVQKWVFDGSAWTEFLGDTSGEDNTGANVGVGTGLIFRDKLGVTLNFKSLIGGANITVTDNADDITITSTGTSPLTTKGDMLGFTTLDARLPVGTDGQLLSANSVQGIGLEWIDAPSSSPLTTKGDLFGFDTDNQRVPVGTDQQILISDPTALTGVRWVDNAGGGGGITGLNPNSTILEYLNNASTVFTDYTTPTAATATSGMTVTSYNETGFANGQNISSSAADGTRVGMQVNAGFVGIGTVVHKISMFLTKNTLPTGNATIGIMTSAETVKGFALIDVSQFTGTAVSYEVTMDIPVTLEVDDYVFIEYLGGDSTNTVGVKGTNGGEPANTSSFRGDPWNAISFGAGWTFDSDPASTAQFAIDGDINTLWQSDAGINESITLDMGGAVNAYGLAYYLSTDAGMTETQFQIRSLAGQNLTGLKAYYKFEQTTGDLLNSCTDAGSVDCLTGKDGVNTGVSQTNSGIIGNAYNYSGTSNSQLEVAATADWEFVYEPNGKFSINFWYKQDVATQAASNTILAMTSTNTEPGFQVQIRGNDGARFIRFFLVNASVQVQSLDSSAGSFPSDTSFHMVTVTGDYALAGNEIEFFVDGVSVGFATTTNIQEGGIGNMPLRIGNAVTGSQPALGDIDELSLFARVISDDEITGVFNSGIGLSLSIGTERVLRTIDVLDLTENDWNFIRFNGVNTRFITIEGSSVGGGIMSANELAVQLEVDPPLTTLHGQFTINGTNANLPLNGGDPTSSVIDDPTVNSLTLNNVGEQGDPDAGKGVLWVETVDANNDGIFAKIKIDGTFKVVRVV